MYDYYPDIRVILPIGDEVGVVVASTLLPGAFDWPKEKRPNSRRQASFVVNPPC